MDQQRTEGHGEHGEARVDRAYAAHQLRLAGHDWATIADRTGYRGPKVAAMAVSTYLQKAALEQSAADRAAALHLELARLDRLQAAYFDGAIAGDVSAANLVLKVITRRSAILGLEKPEETTEMPRTVVIGGSTEEYVAGLQAFIARDAGTDPA